MKKGLVQVDSGDLLKPYSGLEAVDICPGADPFVFKNQGLWHLLVHEDLNTNPSNEMDTYTIRSAVSIPGLKFAKPVPLKPDRQISKLKDVWAAEIHFDKYLYAAASNGDNKTHRIFVYENSSNISGIWQELGQLQVPCHDDSWAIDLTLAQIDYQGETKNYAVWSGWQHPDDEFPQHIYIAPFYSPTAIGERHLIASPVEKWCNSVQAILEGPQSLVLNGEFRGLLVTGNASWTTNYNTRFLKYIGGNPLDSASWKMSLQSLFRDGYGIGHGMIIEDGTDIFYIGHRKTVKTDGWEDRMVFYSKLDREVLEKYLKI